MPKHKKNKRFPEEKRMTIQNDELSPHSEIAAGDSVNEHKNLEVANAIITGDEIKQQNENI